MHNTFEKHSEKIQTWRNFEQSSKATQTIRWQDCNTIIYAQNNIVFT